MAQERRHTGGKPKSDPAAVKRAVELYRTSDMPVKEIVAETGISRTTLFRYLKAFDTVEMATAARGVIVDYAQKPIGDVGYELRVSPPGDGRRKCGQPDYAQYWEMVEDIRNVRLSELHAAYLRECEEMGWRPLKLTSFCSGLRAWRRFEQLADVPEWHAGECMVTFWSQVTANGVARKVFVAKLVFSDATFVCSTESLSPLSWMVCCDAALRYFGGVPHVVDCSAVGVGTAGVTKRTLATLQAFAGYHRFVLYGARPKTSKTAERSAKPLGPWNTSAVLRRIRADLAGAEVVEGGFDEALLALVDKYNRSDFDGRNRLADLRTRELPQMLQLPKKPYDMAIWDVRSVYNDYHFVLGGVRYSVPWQHAGEEVRIRYTEAEVRAYSAGREIAWHERPGHPEGRAVVTCDDHRPLRHRHYARRMDYRFLALAEEFGSSTRSVMKTLLARCRAGGEGFRVCKELLDLAKMPSGLDLEAACSIALGRDGDICVAGIRKIMVEG